MTERAAATTTTKSQASTIDHGPHPSSLRGSEDTSKRHHINLDLVALNRVLSHGNNDA
jgi:hypothetical protein